MRGTALRHCLEISDAKYVICGGAKEHEEALEALNLKIPIISKNKNFGLGRLSDIRGRQSTLRFEDVHPGPMDNSCLI